MAIDKRIDDFVKSLDDDQPKRLRCFKREEGLPRADWLLAWSREYVKTADAYRVKQVEEGVFSTPEKLTATQLVLDVQATLAKIDAEAGPDNARVPPQGGSSTAPVMRTVMDTKGLLFSPRFSYVKYDEASVNLQNQFRSLCEAIEDLANQKLPPTREKSLALTALEEVYMWLGKAIRDEQLRTGRGAVEQPERKSD